MFSDWKMPQLNLTVFLFSFFQFYFYKDAFLLILPFQSTY